MAKAATRAALVAARSHVKLADPEPGNPPTIAASPGKGAAWLVAQPAEVAADGPTASLVTPTTLTLAELAVSDFNVRTNERDNAETSSLERSIANRGIILPLVVHPIGDGRYGVVAGGRRYRSVVNLVARGALPADYALPVVVRDLPDAELVELSTAENFLRRDLHDYEIYTAVVRARAAGDDDKAIAEALGQELTWVRKALRLGTLAAPIFAAYAAARLSLEQARAYAATEDHDLQLAAFETLARLPAYQHTPARIHAELRVADVQLARLLRFVGEAAYRDAGGRYELDLFADVAGTRGRVTDPDLLQALAKDQLDALRADLRRRSGRDLRFAPQPPRNDYGTDFALEIILDPASEPSVDSHDALVLPEGDLFATIDVGETSEAKVRYWWASRAAKAGKVAKAVKPRPRASGLRDGAALDNMNPYGARDALAALREDEGLSASGVDILRSIRRVIMRAMLVQGARELRGSVALDYLVWAQLRMLLVGDVQSTIGIGQLAARDRDPEVASDHVKATRAAAIWSDALRDLHREPFLATKIEPSDSFALYQGLPRATKELAVAVVAGLALDRSLDADGYRIAVHDALARALSHPLDTYDRDRETRHWAAPTEALLALLPGKERLAIAEPWLERVTFGKWQRFRASELTRAVHELLTGTSTAYRDAKAKIAATAWVHPLLRFGTADRPLDETVGARDATAIAEALLAAIPDPEKETAQ